MDMHSDLYLIIASSLLLGILAILIKFFRKSIKLPPGPVGLPILGYLPFLDREAYVTLNELKKKYGSIFSFYLGRKLVVVLGDYNIVKEVLSENAFLGRPERPPNNLLYNAKSFSGSEGNLWREHRRFAMRSLRDLGFGKTVLENQIKEEIRLLVEEMKLFKGKPCDFRKYLQSSIGNNTSVLIFGRRFDFEDSERVFLDAQIRILGNFFRPTSVHAYFTWIRPILSFFRIWNYDILHDSCIKMDQLLNKEIEKHRKTLTEGNIRDYIDDYLVEMKEREQSGSRIPFSMSMLKGNCVSLLTAGMEPVLASVEWIITTIAVYQDIQNKVQKELDEVVGRERLPEWADHVNLPYCNATILEVLRWKTIVPISMLRRTTESSQIRNYNIPKGTIIMTNIWGLHHDPNYWKEPEILDPERFLTEDGKLDKKRSSFIPFSYGRRSCPGETLGQIEVFLYITTILHCFHVRLPEGIYGSFDKDIGISEMIKKYKLCLIPRD